VRKKLETIIKNLIVLQNCELRMKDLERKKAEGPARIRTLEEELKRGEDQLNEEQREIDSARQERRQIEQNIEDLESRLGKSKTKLSNVKSNKEYTAALKEIEEMERQKSLHEDRILEIMESVELLKTKYDSTKYRLEDIRKKIEQDQLEVQKELKTLTREFENHENERNRIRKEFDPELLKKYDHICSHKEGIGVSSVIKGVCQACHMGIPPQKFNELMRGDALMNCPHCMRIIYWGEDKRYIDMV